MASCTGCGAQYPAGDDSCAARFEALLALDHSHQEPWGSRHGAAFAAFALQHPERFAPAVLERSWLLLYSVYLLGRPVERVVQGLRRGGAALDWDVPALPTRWPTPPFRVTIAELGAFDAASYAERLEAWCRATVAAWQAHSFT